MNQKAWVVRANPEHTLRIEEFLRSDIVALGWRKVGNLAGMDLGQIKRLVGRANRITDARGLGVEAGQLNTFVNRISPDDLVLVPDPRDGNRAVFIGAIRGGYRYAKDKKSEGYSHQRPVTWLLDKAPVSRRQLPPSIVRSLKAHQPVTVTDVIALREFLGRHCRDSKAFFFDTDTDTEISGMEGDVSQKLIFVARRDRRLRDEKVRKALAAGGGRLRCEVPGCGFDFFAKYGELGRNFAIVHHCEQLSLRKRSRPTSTTELKIVCANCHAMIHRNGLCRDIEGLIPRSRR